LEADGRRKGTGHPAAEVRKKEKRSGRKNKER
jgi:hypothetical protein